MDCGKLNPRLPTKQQTISISEQTAIHPRHDKNPSRHPARPRNNTTEPMTTSALTGSELLAKVKELGDAPKSELVRSCGYVSTKKDGTERLNFTAFYEALLEAKGMHLGESGHGSKPGRKLSFNTKVQFNGNLMVGKAYTALLDLKPGDEFEIKLGRRQIRLLPLGAPADAGMEDEDSVEDV
jgi:hypothetical protein